ncbi:hypothetical protein LENED_006519 [Lentinula edodes]|uniref:Uncharacterized protein n=1 Tax=Lentinula edodes TaxID=5353 RepID=A0A1Q3EC66_LENED|nr:hypothetical protein LENED_006519 [Lentinula edodes]
MTRQQLSVDEKLGGPSIPVPSIWTSLKPSAAVMFNQVDDIGVPRGIKTLLTLRLHSPTSLSHKCTHLGARKLAEHTLRQWQSVRREQEGISWPISRTKQSTRRKSSTRLIHPNLSVASRNAGADGKDPSEGNKLDAMTYQEIHFSKCVNVPPVV